VQPPGIFTIFKGFKIDAKNMENSNANLFPKTKKKVTFQQGGGRGSMATP